jgi:hypothetical protein
MFDVRPPYLPAYKSWWIESSRAGSYRLLELDWASQRLMSHGVRVSEAGSAARAGRVSALGLDEWTMSPERRVGEHQQ